MSRNVHAHCRFDDFRGSLHSHVRVFDLSVVLVGHLPQVRVDVVEALFVLLKDEIVVVLVHLSNLPLGRQNLLLLRPLTFLDGCLSKPKIERH